MKSHWKAARKAAAIVLLAVLLAEGCAKSTPPTNQTGSAAQSGGAQRYRDVVFEKALRKSDILYRTAENLAGETIELRLDVYRPKGDTETNRPAVILLHAGSLSIGAKNAGLEPVLAKYLAKMGYVAVSIDYRLENPITDWEGTLANATEDAAAAVDWLVENSEQYGVDPNNIVLLGYSAGNYLAIHLVYDDTGIRWKKDSVVGVLSLATSYSSDAFSPEKDDPPCFCIHGSEDKTCPKKYSEKLVEALTNAGVKAELYTVQGADHDLYPYYNEVLNAVADDLYQITVSHR